MTTPTQPAELEKAIELLPCPVCSNRPAHHDSEPGNVRHTCTAFNIICTAEAWNIIATSEKEPSLAKRLKEVEKDHKSLEHSLRKEIQLGHNKDAELSQLHINYKRALEALQSSRSLISKIGMYCAGEGQLDESQCESVKNQCLNELSTPSAIAAMKGQE